MASNKYGMSCGPATALSSSYTGIVLEETKGTDIRSLDVPSGCKLSWLGGIIDTIAASATTITWYVALDSAGDEPITDAVTETILTGKTTATDGGVATVLDLVYIEPDTVTASGRLYVFAKTNTGTCNLLPRLFWSR